MTQLQKIQAHFDSIRVNRRIESDYVTIHFAEWNQLGSLINANPEPPEPIENPPIGLRPRSIVAEDRLVEIVNAIVRTVIGTNPPQPVPAEWIAELAELSAYLRNRKEEA
jgi:hypothetical protein